MNKKQRKITSYFKPIEPQLKIEIPKTTTYEKGKSDFSVLLEDKRNIKLRTKKRGPLVKKGPLELKN